MAQRRNNAQLWLGCATIACVAAAVALVLGSRNGFAERRSAAFDDACLALRAAIAGDPLAIEGARAGFRASVGRTFADRTPYYALHVLDELERRRAIGASRAAKSTHEETVLAAFLRGDFRGALSLARAHDGPTSHYGVRLAETLLRVGAEAPP